MCKNGKEIYRLQKHPDQLITMTELGESGFFFPLGWHEENFKQGVNIFRNQNS